MLLRIRLQHLESPESLGEGGRRGDRRPKAEERNDPEAERDGFAVSLAVRTGGFAAREQT